MIGIFVVHAGVCISAVFDLADIFLRICFREHDPANVWDGIACSE